MRSAFVALSILVGSAAIGVVLQALSPASPPLPEGLARLDLRASSTGTAREAGENIAARTEWSSDAFLPWRRAGFVALEPPIALPGDSADRFHATVAVWLAQGSLIDLEGDAWRWPEGARLDRIEWFLEDGLPRVADVRATELTPRGERFLAYRPSARSRSAPLVGGSFLRGDDAARTRLGSAFSALAERGGVFVASERGSHPAYRASSLRRLAQTHDCVTCHAHAQPEADSRGDRWLRRGTDGAGFYVPAYVMQDHAPMERYRPVNTTADDPLVRASCGGVLVTNDPSTDMRCPDGAMPRLTLDVPAGMAAADARTMRVCASRRWLFDRMTPRAQEHYRSALRACEAP